MRKYIRIGVLLFLVLVVTYLGYNIYTNLQHKKEVANRIKNVPTFTFKTLDNTDFTQQNISQELPKLFIYFNSECEFCNAEARKIQSHLADLQQVQLLFISHEDIQGIKDFAKKYELENKPNIIFLQDNKLEFSEIFGAKTLPYLLLYSKDNKLLQKFKGSTNPKKIISYLPN